MSQNFHRSYNLGKNNNKKKELKPPSLPKLMKNSRANQTAPFFSIFEMGRRGGLNFSFDLSKVLILDRINKQTKKQKTKRKKLSQIVSPPNPPPPPFLPPNQC